MLHIKDIQGEPIVGQCYIVPTCLQSVNDRGLILDVPVFAGGSHSDENESRAHYHVDYRFIEHVALQEWGESEHIPYCNNVMAIENRPEIIIGNQMRLCVRKNPFRPGWRTNYIYDLSRQMKHSGIKLNTKCRVCPHRGTNLNSIGAVNDVIHCPAHGMKFHMVTGEVIV